MTRHLHVLDTGPGGPAWNMALDEALLIQAPTTGSPVLRFYAWTEPAASFGYSQRYPEVTARTTLRPLIRRCTGGGIVPHDRDWTYSLAVPPASTWYQLRAAESYAAMHQWLRDAFRVLGVDTELAPCCRKVAPGECFLGHELSDLLWFGRKVAGAAQRRNRSGLLIQGSVQPPPSVAHRRIEWQQAMAETRPRAHFDLLHLVSLDTTTRNQAAVLETTKYSQDAFNQSR